jgi:hypothetical protein
MPSRSRAEVLIANIAVEVTVDVRKSLILRRRAVNHSGRQAFIPGTAMVRRRQEDEACPALIR